MKKGVLVFYLTLLFFPICDAQNLVPNGSFEQYSSCPTSYSQLDRATPWMNPSTGSPIFTTGSPDYFNQCTSSVASVPQNSCGYQAARTGVAYAGIYLWSGAPNQDSVREYLEVPLVEALVAGNCYHFEMHFSLGDFYKYTASTIGAYFSDTIVSDVPNFFPLPLTPQVANIPGNFPDPINWNLMSGDFTAAGGEHYLIIGNFVDDATTDTVLLSGSAFLSASYIFIDDVSLVPTMPCNHTQIDLPESTHIEVFPNPAAQQLHISTGSDATAEVTIFELNSRKVMHQAFSNFATLDIAYLQRGIYLYEVRLDDGSVKQGKFVKQ